MTAAAVQSRTMSTTTRPPHEHAATPSPALATAAASTSMSVWPWVEPVPGLSLAPSPAPEAPGGRWPKVSIVTPNYNYAGLIEGTLRSVLNQGYPDLEYIVIDDGSTDDSVDVIRRYGDRLAHWEQHPNQGQYGTINKGMKRATGE